MLACIQAFYRFSVCFKHRISITSRQGARTCRFHMCTCRCHMNIETPIREKVETTHARTVRILKPCKEPIRGSSRSLYDYYKSWMGIIYLWACMWPVGDHTTDDCLRAKLVASPCLKVVELSATRYTASVWIKIILKIVRAQTVCRVITHGPSQLRPLWGP